MTGNPESVRKELMRRKAYDFCQALMQKSPEEVLEIYMTSNSKITEHGPEWAAERLPFLGKTFEGKSECARYFKVLSETLKMDMDENSYPNLAGFSADVAAEAKTGADELASRETGTVNVVGKGRFTSLRTGKSWEEEFIYRFSGFDDNGRFGHWEIWADPLSAWIAVGDERAITNE